MSPIKAYGLLFGVLALLLVGAFSLVFLLAPSSDKASESRRAREQRRDFKGMGLSKAGAQGRIYFMVASEDLAAGTGELEGALRGYCDRYSREWCQLLVWPVGGNVPARLPMGSGAVKSQIAKYARNDRTGHDCFYMLRDGDMVESTRSAGCS